MDNKQALSHLCEKYSLSTDLGEAVMTAFELMVACFSSGGKVLVCGNGGSCSDADHIVGELVKSFESSRPVDKALRESLLSAGGETGKILGSHLQMGLPAISLSSQNSLLTAICNDMSPDYMFAQQALVYGNKGDLLIGLSTSGNSKNVINALITARAKEMKTIGLTGETGGRMKDFCDVLINVPARQTAAVQELHLPVYHVLCRMTENHFFGNQD